MQRPIYAENFHYDTVKKKEVTQCPGYALIEDAKGLYMIADKSFIGCSISVKPEYLGRMLMKGAGKKKL